MLTLNHFVEDDIIVYGTVNGIDTSIIIDSGAKISVVSDDFVELDMEPVSFVPISGISQVPKSIPVFSMPISLPTMQGGCLLAMDTRLPPQTVLLGLDFGLENIVNLINHVNADPYPVLTVTRAMQADSDLAAHTSDVLHVTEGAKPTSFDELHPRFRTRLIPRPNPLTTLDWYPCLSLTCPSTVCLSKNLLPFRNLTLPWHLYGS